MRPLVARGAGITLAQRPHAAFPAFLPLAGDDLGEVHADEARPVLRAAEQRGNVELARRFMRDHRIGRAVQADAAGERAGVYAGKADLALRRQPFGKAALRAEAGRLGHILAHHAAHRAVYLRFEVFVIRADIADMGEGEGDNLARIGRVRHHFLIARHRGVEAHFAHRAAGGAEALAPYHRAVGEHEDSRRALGWRVRGCGVGHEALRYKGWLRCSLRLGG